MTTHPPSYDDELLPVGVIGVGSMGEKHARVYSELRDVDLVGVTDLDRSLARSVATAHGTAVRSFEELLDRCAAVSVAVPTHAHEETVTRCLEAGVDVLVEKPIAPSVDAGSRLARRADELDRVLQVGHIERFNPAVQATLDLVADLDVIAVDAQRLGPPVDRAGSDGVIYDLMVHDVDIVTTVLGSTPTVIGAAQTAGGQYATASLEYGDVLASFSASRVTQKKVRRLVVTARECLLEVDYLSQSVLIHRDSYPAYVTDDGPTRYRHESVVEHPRIDNGEPLKRELEAFTEAVRTRAEPVVTAADGVTALELVQQISRRAATERQVVSP